MNDWAFTQAGRAGKIATALGPDKLLLESFTAFERFNEPFEITVDVLSQDPALDFTPHLGSGVSLSMAGRAEVSRSFHGVLFDAALIAVDGSAGRYRITLRPWLALLDLGRDSRIYQKMTVQGILGDVFERAGFTDYALNLTKRATSAREYCVQFRESDFNFVSRLMEEEGLFYYFQHTAASHKMIISDDAAAQPTFATPIEVYQDDRTSFRPPHLWLWGDKVRPALNKVSLRDQHFRKPTPLTAESTDKPDSGSDKAEFYDYPAGFGYFADDGSAPGASDAESRLLASRSMRKTFHGEGDTFAIPVGSVINIAGSVEAAKALVISATHRFSGQHYQAAGAQDAAADIMEVRFESITSGVDWRPARKTPKPLAGGPQTAVVVGGKDETIEVDEYGRIHIQFPWDRVGALDSKSSCWVRVSQSSADGKFGHMHIPRIGEEVIVDFLDGDPDRPIVTGRVYNSSLMPPYALPADKTKSTWKSQTIGKSGTYEETETPPTDTGFHEIRFEDKGGEEEMFIHAQRDLLSWVRHDETRRTGHDTSVRVGRNRETAIKKNETLTVETGDETRTIQQGSRTTTIEKADTTTLNQGDYSLKISAGQATVDAMQKITLKVGSNQIVISQQGIEISGLTVKMTATTSLAVKGLTSEFKADTMLTVNGLMVQIN
jgi:type VI secretion system secreted protein VgrG